MISASSCLSIMLLKWVILYFSIFNEQPTFLLEAKLIVDLDIGINFQFSSSVLVAIFTLGVSCGVLLHAEGHGSEHIGLCCLVISARSVTCLFLATLYWSCIAFPVPLKSCDRAMSSLHHTIAICSWDLVINFKNIKSATTAQEAYIEHERKMQTESLAFQAKLEEDRSRFEADMSMRLQQSSIQFEQQMQQQSQIFQAEIFKRLFDKNTSDKQ